MNNIKPTKASDEGKLPPELVPIWFRLPVGFYKSLQAISREVGLSDADVLKKGARLVLREYRMERSQPPVKDSAAQRLVSQRWANVSPEQRSQAAREMSQRRWAKRREK